MKDLINFICKERVAVYTTTTLKLANIFIKNLPTITNTLFNTPKVAFQQPYRQC